MGRSGSSLLGNGFKRWNPPRSASLVSCLFCISCILAIRRAACGFLSRKSRKLRGCHALSMKDYLRRDNAPIIDQFDNETFPSLSLHEKRRLFYALHFQPDEEGHVGVQFAVVKHRIMKDGRLGRRTRDILASYSDTLFFADFEQKSGQDAYITASQFRDRKSRRRSNLLCFNNLVLDLDAHGVPMKYMDEIMDKLETGLMYGIFYEDILPMPNTIVRTGRGLQLWWNIEQMPASLGFIWKKVASFFCDEVEGFLGDNADKFPGVGLDRAASCNPSGLFRMPGSYNTAARKAGSFEILHIDQFDPVWHYDRHMKKEEDKEKGGPSSGAAGGRLLADRRARQLASLLEIRGRDVKGFRDLFCFCLACIYGRVLDREGIYEKVRAMNASFLEPLPEGELRSSMSSVLSRPHAISNRVLIEKLAITREEQELTGIGISKRVLARERKKERDRKIAELTRQGRPNTAIAAIVGCARSTVTAVQKRLGMVRAGLAKREKAGDALKEGMSAKAAAAASGLSLSAVYAMLKRAFSAVPKSPVPALNRENYGPSFLRYPQAPARRAFPACAVSCFQGPSLPFSGDSCTSPAPP